MLYKIRFNSVINQTFMDVYFIGDVITKNYAEYGYVNNPIHEFEVGQFLFWNDEGIGKYKYAHGWYVVPN